MHEGATGTPVHPTLVELEQPCPAEIPVGIDVLLSVSVSCPSGCDHRGLPVRLLRGDEEVTSGDLALFHDGGNETDGFTFKAPDEPANHAWQLVFPRHVGERCVHEEGVLPISFATVPHMTSMAVWDVPFPIPMDSGFTVKVGVKCHAHCPLRDHIVDVVDEDGVTQGAGRLSDTPWPETSSLHWTAIELKAPNAEGMMLWIARFRGAKSGLAHEGTLAAFSFRVARPAEISITTEIVTSDTGLPVPDAEVRMGPYQGFTDSCGQAVFNVPRAAYTVSVRKDGFRAEPLRVEALEDATVRVDVTTEPTHAELVDMMKRFEGEYWRP